MKDEALKLFRSANREHLHFLWEKAKNNDRYVSLLKKFKSRKPDKIWKLLDSLGDVGYLYYIQFIILNPHVFVPKSRY